MCLWNVARGVADATDEIFVMVSWNTLLMTYINFREISSLYLKVAFLRYLFNKIPDFETFQIA